MISMPASGGRQPVLHAGAIIRLVETVHAAEAVIGRYPCSLQVGGKRAAAQVFEDPWLAAPLRIGRQRVAHPDRHSGIAAVEHFQQHLAHAAQLMHMLMAVDEIRRLPESGLERRQLPMQRIAQQRRVQTREQAAQDQALQVFSGKCLKNLRSG